MKRRFEFSIPGQVMGGKNNMMLDPRSGRHYPKKDWAAWRDKTVASIKDQAKPCAQTMICTPCKIEVVNLSEDMRRHDVPAMLDSLFHCLEEAGIVEDDALIRDVWWRWAGVDSVFPCVTIRIVEF